MQFEIKVSLKEAPFEDAVTSAVARELVGRVEKTVNDRIDATIGNAITEAFGARVEAEVTTLLTDGWDTFDSYGKKKERQTIKGIVTDMVDKLEKDRYGRYNMSTLVHEALAKQFNEVVADGIKRLKEKIDAIINETIEETITDDIRKKLRGALAT